MRLIDADAFEANMQNEWERGEISNGEWIRFREMINDEPTIDAVEVVRCKDCVFQRLGFCRFWQEDITESDYCSYGEEAEK